MLKCFCGTLSKNSVLILWIKLASPSVIHRCVRQGGNALGIPGGSQGSDVIYIDVIAVPTNRFILIIIFPLIEGVPIAIGMERTMK